MHLFGIATVSFNIGERSGNHDLKPSYHYRCMMRQGHLIYGILLPKLHVLDMNSNSIHPGA